MIVFVINPMLEVPRAASLYGFVRVKMETATSFCYIFNSFERHFLKQQIY